MCILSLKQSWSYLKSHQAHSHKIHKRYPQCVPQAWEGLVKYDPVLINKTVIGFKACHVCLITYSHMFAVLMAQSKYCFMISVVATCAENGSSTHRKRREWEASVIFLKALPEEKHKYCQLIELLKSFKTLTVLAPLATFVFTHLLLSCAVLLLLSVSYYL